MVQYKRKDVHEEKNGTLAKSRIGPIRFMYNVRLEEPYASVQGEVYFQYG